MTLFMMCHLYACLKIFRYFTPEAQNVRFYRTSYQVLCHHWQFESTLYLELSIRYIFRDKSQEQTPTTEAQEKKFPTNVFVNR
jgi:hypothetical protein